MKITSRTHIGNVRASNQDALLLQDGKLKSCKIGREYKIAKCHLIEFLETNLLEAKNDR